MTKLNINNPRWDTNQRPSSEYTAACTVNAWNDLLLLSAIQSD